ncbi:YbhB/YbcL family Raf kinase inhibitor-like protein [Nocardia transvalensis]|uniref:YbhB/YbcL family Raf kinase inhibitor-like protein n=1 Tax=Nocardia transvalensis TaxID=37333 RepID=UPI0018954EF6|nr:YbhB/YbcL family Raf kinase inhibitor-like protein [Nocardia transvalensis]MBF6328211.1 YbhB/YbcL family Raf kinase inhibitor-like protein [Nocardia transvalensis]
MTAKRIRLASVAASALALAACAERGTSATETATTAPSQTSTPPTHEIRVTSSAFSDGSTIPTEYTCTGTNEPPPLLWTTPPETARMALIVDDPDAPNGPFTHWVVIDIPATTTSVEQGQTPAPGTVLRNSAGRTDYVAPCPPPGTGVHHYRFTMYALPNRLSLSPDTPPDRARAAIEQAAIAEGRLVGTYSR